MSTLGAALEVTGAIRSAALTANTVFSLAAVDVDNGILVKPTLAAVDASNAAAYSAPLITADDIRASFTAAYAVDAAAYHELGADGRRALIRRPLWPTHAPADIRDRWTRERLLLGSAVHGTKIWVDWYDRRLKGRAQGFDLSPDADAEMNRRLIAQDNEWWERDPAAVNADIAAWLAEQQWHDLVSRVDRISKTVEAGAVPDFSSHEAESALNTMTEAAANVLAALEAVMPPAAGGNYFETDDILPADSQAQEAAHPSLAAPQLPDTVAAELHTLREEVKALKRAAVLSQPDPKQLGKSLIWLKNRLEQYRQVSPEFMKQFEGKLGLVSAGGVVVGVLWAFPEVVSLLEILFKSLLTWLEVAFRIAP